MAVSSGPQLAQTTLDNGLTVIARPMREAPIGSFWIWYRVGARNEVPGITGISHWVEHMLFKGTRNLPAGEIFRRVSAAGGMLNGFTWIDYTTYFETLPIDRIDLALEIESDRMVNARFDPEEVESERTVILSERQGSENQPTFHLREEVTSAAFRAHPYRQGVIGYTSDLQGITRDELHQHYQTFYRPNNALAVFVGDLAAEEAIERISSFFGELASGPPLPPVRTVEPEPQGERRVEVRRPAPSAMVSMAFLAPAASSADIPALIVLDAVLSGGKPFSFSGAGGTIGRSSRLYRRLVSTGMTAGASSNLALSIDPYLFSVSAIVTAETSPEDVEAVLDEELERLAAEPVGDEEMERAKRQLRAQFGYARESVTSLAYWVGSLAAVAPERDAESFIDEVDAVTVEDVERVAARYLTRNRRTTGWLLPTE